MINNSTKYIQDVWRVKILNQKPTCKPEMGNQKAYTYKINFRRKKKFNCIVLRPWTSSDFSNEVLKCKKSFFIYL